MDNVREALGGTGSKSTIAPYLKRWKTEQQDVLVTAQSRLPAALLQAVKRLYEHMQGEFVLQLEQEKQQHQVEKQAAVEREQQLRNKLGVATAANDTLSGELMHTRDVLTQLQAVHQAQNVTLATVQAENIGLQQRLTDRAAEISTLDQQLSQTRAQFEHYQEATATQRAEERQAFEQRIARLDHDLAAASRHGTAQQATFAQQEALISHLQAERKHQDQVLHGVQDELTTMRSSRDRLSAQVTEVTAMKDDLAGRLTTAQQRLADMQSDLAVKERETALLTEQLRREEERVEQSLQENSLGCRSAARLNSKYDTPWHRMRPLPPKGTDIAARSYRTNASSVPIQSATGLSPCRQRWSARMPIARGPR